MNSNVVIASNHVYINVYCTTWHSVLSVILMSLYGIIACLNNGHQSDFHLHIHAVPL